MPIKHPHEDERLKPSLNDTRAQSALDRYTKALRELEEVLLKAQGKKKDNADT